MPDDRTYITVHDGMPDHPKIEGLSDPAFRLLIECWCWCSRNLTDGQLPKTSWEKRGTPRSRRELLDGGLVHDKGSYFYMHDYLEHQRSADEVRLFKAKKGSSGTYGNHVRWHDGEGREPSEDCSHCIAEGLVVRSQTDRKRIASAIANGSQTIASTTTTTETKKETSSPRKRGTRIPDDFTVTPEMTAWAKERVPQLQGLNETEKFINYWRAASGRTATKLDWGATWRNWMLNAAERTGTRKPSGAAVGQHWQDS